MSQQFDMLTLAEQRANTLLPDVPSAIRPQSRLMDGDTLPFIVVSQVGDPTIVLEWMPNGTAWEYAVRVTLFDALANPRSESELEDKVDRAEAFRLGMYDPDERPTGCFQVDASATNPIEPTSGPTRTYATTAVVLRFQFETTRP